MFQAADLKMEAESLIKTMKKFGKFLGDDATLESEETMFHEHIAFKLCNK